MHYLVIMFALAGVPGVLCSGASWDDTKSHSQSSIAGDGKASTAIVSPTSTGTHQSKTLQACTLPTTLEVPGAKMLFVVVGAGGDLQFNPNSVKGKIGDIVNFDFLGRNHTLTQSSFFDPCKNEGGISTGFNQFNPKNESGSFIFQYRIRTLDPQWFFCAQSQPKSHCQAGMVFAINPKGKMQDFIQAAQMTTRRNAASNVTNDKTDPDVDLQASPTAASTAILFASPTGNSSVKTPKISVAPTPLSTAARQQWGGLATTIVYLTMLLAFF